MQESIFLDIIKEIEIYARSKPVVNYFRDNKAQQHFSINGKTFLVISEQHCPHLFLKNAPVINQILRKRFDFILPSYIFNKTYWNTLILKQELEINTIKKMIDISYDLSLKKMNKKQKFHYEFLTSI